MYLGYITNLRAIAILAIVLHHTMFAFSGWPPCILHGVEVPDYFSHICQFLRTAGLGLFTYISGYLFNVGMEDNPKKSFGSFLKSKVLRLIIPLIFFGFLYWLLFPKYVGGGYRFPVIEGSPLWYLPMLFIFFATSFIIVKICNTRKRISAIFIAEILFYVICKLEIPFSGGLFIYYPCFVLGMYHDRIIQNRKHYRHSYQIYRHIYILTGIWLLLITLVTKVFLTTQILILLNMATAILSSLILFTLFQRKNFKFPKLLEHIGKKSFGIYLTHQFIINSVTAIIYFEGMALPNITVLFLIVILLSIMTVKFLGYEAIGRLSKYIGI